MKNLILVFVCLIFIPLHTECRFFGEIEGGLLWQTRNDVQIPNNTDGTRFSLVDLVGKGPLPWFRLYFTWSINERHNLYGLYAPLSYTKSGVFETDVNFAGKTYSQDVSVDATYKFNSYRLGYYFLLNDNLRFLIGFTAKIRDAKIGLKQSDKISESTDLGFVPLLHLGIEKEFMNKFGFTLDIEGLAGGPGRAIDGAAKVFYYPTKSFRLALGYRTVEGGADVESVYNFAWVHYGMLSMMFRF